MRRSRWKAGRYRLCFARLVTQYLRHAAWLQDGVLLRDVATLASIPGVLIHGRRDLSPPLDVAWMLSESWDNSELLVIDDAGHTGSPAMTTALLAAINGFGGS